MIQATIGIFLVFGPVLILLHALDPDAFIDFIKGSAAIVTITIGLVLLLDS